ncbi:hypothetical protein KEM52_001306 [Ascosphaera acerosa]|nr:hypothetical protein KEM52_001306 [Ascosphaera acerosa]
MPHSRLFCIALFAVVLIPVLLTTVSLLSERSPYQRPPAAYSDHYNRDRNGGDGVQVIDGDGSHRPGAQNPAARHDDNDDGNDTVHGRGDGNGHGDDTASASASPFQRLKSFLTFRAPASIFPPSAIISLTDDNATFFLARPAAFGPPLPAHGLSGRLWIGGGFDDDAIEVHHHHARRPGDGVGFRAEGELGCADVPDTYWDEHSESTAPAASASSASSAGLKGARRGKPRSGDIQSLQETSEITGTVVLLRRGGCGFLEKVRWAQRRGATAVIVGDNIRGGNLVTMYAHGDTANVSIPALFTSYTTAHLLSALAPDAVYGYSRGASARVGGGASVNTNEKDRQAASKDKSGQPVYLCPTILKLLRLCKSQSEPMSHAAIMADDRVRPPRSGTLRFDDGASGDASSRSARGAKETRSKSKSGSEADRGVVTTPQPDAEEQQRDQARQHRLGQPESSAGSQVEDQERDNRDAHAEDQTLTKDRARNVKALPFGSPAISNAPSTTPASTTHAKQDASTPSANPPLQRGGLWVTLTPTTMSASPLLDTLLVLVVSPLITLTVVYSMLVVRSRIRRHRWRAPKSIVDRLPVRTYHTIAPTPSPQPSPSPSSASIPQAAAAAAAAAAQSAGAATPSSPLLAQQQHGRHCPPAPPPPRASTSHQQRHAASHPIAAPSRPTAREGDGNSGEKIISRSLLWKRKYHNRQVECAVCLEEYVDGESKVMSLPCGHEFHVECITPWLTRRRRTCPICKGDVVRSLTERSRVSRRASASAGAGADADGSAEEAAPLLGDGGNAGGGEHGSSMAIYETPFEDDGADDAEEGAAQRREVDEGDYDTEEGIAIRAAPSRHRHRQRRRESDSRSSVRSALRGSSWREFAALGLSPFNGEAVWPATRTERRR